MRSLIILVLVLLTVSAGAMTPDYDSSRRYVEERHKSDKTPLAARVFVICSTNDIILRYRKAITLRDVIDTTVPKGKGVSVYVLRESQQAKPVFDDVVPPSGKPSFVLKPRDLIFLFPDDGTHTPRF